MLSNNENTDMINTKNDELGEGKNKTKRFNIKDVAFGIGNKIGDVAKDIVDKNKYELDTVLNKVIDGEYMSSDIVMKKGVLHIP